MKEKSEDKCRMGCIMSPVVSGHALLNFRSIEDAPVSVLYQRL